LFIGLGLNLIIASFFLPSINPRLGNPSVPFEFDGEPMEDSHIWFSITPIDNELVITTYDRKVFRWPLVVKNHSEIQNFIDYLKTATNTQITNATLSMDTNPNNFAVIISADQKLKFIHIRPILYALAEARISKYAFEVRSSTTAENTSTSSHL
jgi:hypothetical protein